MAPKLPPDAGGRTAGLHIIGKKFETTGHPIGYRLQATATTANRPLFLNLIGPGCHHPPKNFLSVRPGYRTRIPEQSIQVVNELSSFYRPYPLPLLRIIVP